MRKLVLLFAALLPFVLLTSCYRVEKVEVGDTVNGTVWVTEDTGGWFGIGPGPKKIVGMRLCTPPLYILRIANAGSNPPPLAARPVLAE